MKALGPGSTIGILGGGQLARMLAFEARRMGYRTAVLDPDPAGPAGQVVDEVIVGELDDVDAALRLARIADVLTLDTEHVPADLLERLESVTPVRPGSHVLRVIQDRRAQREFLAGLGVPQTLHAFVDDLPGLRAAAALTGFPCVLKTRRAGYDGKGQARLDGPADLESGWRAIGAQPAVLESFVDFACEVSVVMARGLAGAARAYPPAENLHTRHVLDTSIAPARIPASVADQAVAAAMRIAEALDHVGVLCVEYFLTHDGRLLVNEIAPRTHNSGHYTLGGCVTSQFEQHLRAICGLGLGDTTLLSPVLMANILGDQWETGEPDWRPILDCSDVQLHLYGKAVARPGRKMGHLLIFGEPGPALARLGSLRATSQPGRLRNAC